MLYFLERKIMFWRCITMRNSKKLKQKKKEINILIGASATIIAAFIMRGNQEIVIL